MKLLDKDKVNLVRNIKNPEDIMRAFANLMIDDFLADIEYQKLQKLKTATNIKSD